MTIYGSLLASKLETSLFNDAKIHQNITKHFDELSQCFGVEQIVESTEFILNLFIFICCRFF